LSTHLFFSIYHLLRVHSLFCHSIFLLFLFA
jgi:hypothetical protein